MGIEGDENSKFFHASLWRNSIKSKISVISVDGTWCEDPASINQDFYSYVSTKLGGCTSAQAKICSKFFKSLDIEATYFLEAKFTEMEIWNVVNHCGNSKSHSLDGFNFKFFRKCWLIIEQDLLTFLDSIKFGDYRPISLIGSLCKIIAKSLVERLKNIINSLSGESGNAFVGGRFILDGVLVVGATFVFLRKNTKKLAIFKCRWIEVCLSSRPNSVLINEVPTPEFRLHTGVRQGDPLSPFLLLIDVGLNVSMKKLINQDVFRWDIMGVSVSHLQGFKFNLSKSKLYGVGVLKNVLFNTVLLVGCSAGSQPFTYHGLSVEKNMNKIESWDLIVDKFKAKLTSWKILILVLGSLSLYFFPLLCSNSMLKQLERCATFEELIEAFLGMVVLWWRFYISSDALWVRGGREES
ncbi:hypothetical protein OSB04_024984 [Centaurea solstitialis]|uniref:Reverse transcriptase n=1 Tax=Centaurea solstitialis TaxID=347529 RepID=A0AA38T5P5_9ASTR|nr:hypothetical protein OSB04_024984 [Centaurea solstitialis]